MALGVSAWGLSKAKWLNSSAAAVGRAVSEAVIQHIGPSFLCLSFLLGHILILLPVPGFVLTCALAHCQIHQTILEPFLLLLVGWVFVFFFCPVLSPCPHPAPNTVVSPKVTRVVSPAKEMREHRAFCPQSIRLGQGTNVSFYFLCSEATNNEGFGHGNMVRQMHSLNKDLQFEVEMLGGRWGEMEK